MHTELTSPSRPPIALIDTEADILSDLAMASLHKSAMTAELLLQELSRADVFERSLVPSHIATMNSQVVFIDEHTGDRHEVQLVYPSDADSNLHRVSVLTPIGAALIGMPRGASIEWPNRSGENRRLTILEVAQPPERE